MRAADDPMHCKIIERFSLQKKKSPITQEIINNFQYLTPDIIRRDSEFKNAEISVQSNQERVLFGRMKAIRFAEDNKETVFSWVLNMNTDKLNGDKERSNEWVEVGAIELEYFFVRGMPMIISCKGK